MYEWTAIIPMILLHELPMLVHAGVLKGAPLLWATLGGAFSERSGIINIGLEGMMLAGAFAAVAASGLSGNPWAGLMAGAVCGGLFGLVHALVCIRWKADQIVSGMGINLFSLGITGFLLFQIFKARGNSPEVPKIPTIQGWSDIPILSDLFFPLSPLHILLFLMIGFTIFVFYQTAFGLRLRACGEDPRVVKAAGVRASLYRYGAVGISGVMAGLGGVQLALCDVSQFSQGMTNGRGFVALAALICSGWRPGRAALICFLFGCAEALGERLQGAFPLLPSRAYLALPFVLALIVLSLRKTQSRPPRALGKV
ncbi:MAG: ABC transporter permease [Candidatus Omnitrophota bacterium]|jgi:simple sugar transport system permease protein|nr:MAG: ABC transporter permease [Candidatus Omnitrophota bacterium]